MTEQPIVSGETEEMTGTLKAGRELDALVAHEVFGMFGFERIDVVNGPDNELFGVLPGNRAVNRVPYFSTSIADAWEVVAKLRADGWVYFRLQSGPFSATEPEWDDATMTVQWWAEFSRYRSPIEVTSPECDTPALAICLAALAVESEK